MVAESPGPSIYELKEMDLNEIIKNYRCPHFDTHGQSHDGTQLSATTTVS